MTAFDTILVANRGEIARRIIRGARRVGLRTVAVFSDADRAAPHVREADSAVRIGSAAAGDSYLRVDALIAAARGAGAGAVHPGYGFLAENAAAARALEAAGIRWIGPTPEQIELFGSKHTAREIAARSGLALLPGTALLASVDEAVHAAARIGYPVIVKAAGGGGGIGMRICEDAAELRASWDAVNRLAESNFGVGGVFLERLVRPARHVEVQIFGDGEGGVAVLGDRDCTLQRRNQKVLEEAPAPALSDAVRLGLHEGARALARSVSYRSAGTVEFVYDPVRQEAFFLEVNARLQVEHPVTEAVTGLDLVELMLTLARDGAAVLPPGLLREKTPPPAVGHAVEARIYAEDPARGNAPSTGLITRVVLPDGDGIRVDAWIETGTEVTAHYDPLLAKVIAHAPTRREAFDRLHRALAETRIDGIVTTTGMLREIAVDESVRAVEHDTTTLQRFGDPDPRIEVIAPGLHTTVQDLPGRRGYWSVGVPPSGPMDPVSFRAANRAVGNDPHAPALEATLTAPTLVFADETVVCVSGAEAPVRVDGVPAPQWEPVRVRAGGRLEVGPIDGRGMRVYIAVRGGLDVPEYLGSAATFDLGGFGGHGGRALVAGDVLRPGRRASGRPVAIPASERPRLTHDWEIAVTEGPHTAPDFFTRADLAQLYSSVYDVQVNSARTGVRLTGPKPQWARADGGEAGLHPSNIHDTPYAVGAIDFTGDTPIILGPDGPSLGGFVCPAVVASADLWKIGQLRPGDRIRFAAVRESDAARLSPGRAPAGASMGDGDDGILGVLEEQADDRGTARPKVVYRRDGDDNVLVEYGAQTLDLALRMRVHALQTRLELDPPPGVLDVTPGIRSLQIHTDPDIARASTLVGLLRELEEELPPASELTVPSREVRLPLSWDDPATRLAIERYMAGVRDDAPWTPWNIEFIRRINGLDSVDEVYRTVFDAEYLVLGLGDVYLGAPVATPLDPRHRLVTTKYNPARTWTAENSVGIGGAYLCIYGMEGPGGYQFVGRTTQVWNRFRRSGMFAEQPWSLRFFDRVRWYPVSADELLELRAETDAGRGRVDVTPGVFSLADHVRFLEREADSIAGFRDRQRAAFAEERARWEAAGEFDRVVEPPPTPATTTAPLPPGTTAVTAPFAASVWRVHAEVGTRVEKDEQIMILEAMKMEATVTAPIGGTISKLFVNPGETVPAGHVLAAIEVGA